MASNQIVDLADGGEDYVLIPEKSRILSQLSDGSYVAVVTNNTTTVTLYHSPDKVTWTSRGTFVVDSWGGASGGSGRGIAVAIASNNDLHICWQNASDVVRYIKMTFVAGTPTWTAGTAENSIATSTGYKSALSIEVLDSGVIVIACVRNPNTGSTDTTGRVRCRNSGGTWGTEQGITLPAQGPFERIEISCSLARDAGGASGGVQNCWLMMCGGGTATWIHRVLAVTLTTGNFTLTTPPAPIPVASYNSWGTVFSVAANKWWFAGYTRTSSTASTLYVAEASATAVTHSASFAMGANFNMPIDTTIPPQAKITAVYLPDRIVFAGLGEHSYGTSVPKVRWFSFILSGGVFVPDRDNNSAAYMETSATGMPSVSNNSGVYIMGGDVNRNQSGTEHCVLLVETSTDKVYAHWADVPVQSGTPALTPAAGATVTTDIPLLERSLVPRGHRVEWTLAEDAAFSVNAKSVLTLVNRHAVPDGVLLSEVVPTASQLRQVLWYMRSRIVDLIGQASAWIATQSFTVTHPPSASPTAPISDVTVDYQAGTLTFDWTYSDTSPVDPQTAYQIIVERNSDGAAVADSGKVIAGGVVGTENEYGVPLAGRGNLAIGSGFKDITLRWKVRVYDSDDVVSAYSAYALFRTSDKPAVAVTAPTEGGTATSPAPLVSWTFSATGGRTQATYRVIITRTSDGVIIHDSGTKAGASTSYQVPQAVLVNTVAYSVAVTVTDSVGLSQTDSNAFTATWTPPAVPSGVAVNAATMETNGYISISWTATTRDAEFYGWRIYRRVNGDTGSGTLIFDTTSALTGSYQDWQAGSGISYQYNVVQVANRFGSLVESNPSWQAAVTGSSENYWLIHPDDNALNIRIINVVSDDYSEEYESEPLNLIGRGRKMDYGTRFGYTGQLVCQVYGTSTLTARQARQQIETMKAELRELYLRNPFGDVWLVALGDLSVSRIAGVGTREFVTLTIPYREVA